MTAFFDDEIHEELDRDQRWVVSCSICSLLGIGAFIYSIFVSIENEDISFVAVFGGLLGFCLLSTCYYCAKIGVCRCCCPCCCDDSPQQHQQIPEYRPKDEEWCRAAREGKSDEYLNKVEEGRGGSSAPKCEENLSARKDNLGEASIPREKPPNQNASKSRSEENDSSKPKEGRSINAPVTGDRIVISWPDTEIDGHKGIIVGPKSKSTGLYPVCVDSKDGIEGTIVHLPFQHIKPKIRKHKTKAQTHPQ